MNGKFRRPSPAIVVAVVALFAALGGTSYAASKITGKSVKDSSLTGKDIKNKSLSKSDFKGSVRGARGPKGDPGAKGAQGLQGPAGPSVLGQLNVVNSPQVPFGSNDLVRSATAFCPAGQRVVSGGGATVTDEQLAASQVTNGRTGWFVIGVDLQDNGGEYVQAQALCAPAGAAVAASTGSESRLRAKAQREVAQLEAAIRAKHRR